MCREEIQALYSPGGLDFINEYTYQYLHCVINFKVSSNTIVTCSNMFLSIGRIIIRKIVDKANNKLTNDSILSASVHPTCDTH